MRKSLLVSMIGMLTGALLGGLLAYGLQPSSEPASGWTSYPTIADVTQGGAPHLWQHVINYPPLRYYLFIGILIGGGFGSLVGVLIGSTGVIEAALREVAQQRSSMIAGRS